MIHLSNRVFLLRFIAAEVEIASVTEQTYDPVQ